MAFDQDACRRLWSIYRTYVHPPPPRSAPAPFQLPSGSLSSELPEEPFRSRWLSFEKNYLSLRLNHGRFVAQQLIKEIKSSSVFLKALGLGPDEVETHVLDKVESKWALAPRFSDITGEMWETEWRNKCFLDKWADREIQHQLRTMFLRDEPEVSAPDRRPFEEYIQQPRRPREWGLGNLGAQQRTLPQTLRTYKLTIEQCITALQGVPQATIPEVGKEDDENDGSAQRSSQRSSQRPEGLFLTGLSKEDLGRLSSAQLVAEAKRRELKVDGEGWGRTLFARRDNPSLKPTKTGLIAGLLANEKTRQPRQTMANLEQLLQSSPAPEGSQTPEVDIVEDDEEDDEEDDGVTPAVRTPGVRRAGGPSDDESSGDEEEGSGSLPPDEGWGPYLKNDVQAVLFAYDNLLIERRERVDGKFQYRLKQGETEVYLAYDSNDGRKILQEVNKILGASNDFTKRPTGQGRRVRRRSVKASSVDAPYKDLPAFDEDRTGYETPVGYSSSEESNTASSVDAVDAVDAPGYASSQESNMASSVDAVDAVDAPGYASSQESNMASSVSSVGFTSGEESSGEASSGESNVVSSQASVASCTEIYDPSMAKDNDEWMAAAANFRENTSYVDEDGVALPTGSLISYVADGVSRTMMILQVVREGDQLISTDFRETFLQDMTSRAELAAQGFGPEKVADFISQRGATQLKIEVVGNRLVGVRKL